MSNPVIFKDISPDTALKGGSHLFEIKFRVCEKHEKGFVIVLNFKPELDLVPININS